MEFYCRQQEVSSSTVDTRKYQGLLSTPESIELYCRQKVVLSSPAGEIKYQPLLSTPRCIELYCRRQEVSNSTVNTRMYWALLWTPGSVELYCRRQERELQRESWVLCDSWSCAACLCKQIGFLVNSLLRQTRGQAVTAGRRRKKTALLAETTFVLSPFQGKGKSRSCAVTPLPPGQN